MGHFEILGHVRGTCHSSYTLSKGPKNPSPNIVAQSLIDLSSVLEFPKITFFRQVQTLEALIGNTRGAAMVFEIYLRVARFIILYFYHPN